MEKDQVFFTSTSKPSFFSCFSFNVFLKRSLWHFLTTCHKMKKKISNFSDWQLSLHLNSNRNDFFRTRTQVMFPEDTGNVEIRSKVHVYRLYY